MNTGFFRWLGAVGLSAVLALAGCDKVAMDKAALQKSRVYVFCQQGKLATVCFTFEYAVFKASLDMRQLHAICMGITPLPA
ncbi:MAG: hypothetical protein IJR28_04810 [Ottowia sp.]|nr:hypothetical protein [Ottowia sp.]